MILFYSFLSNASTLLLFLISDKSWNEMLVTQTGIYRNEKALKICVKKDSNKLAGWFQFQLLLDNEVCSKKVFVTFFAVPDVCGDVWKYVAVDGNGVYRLYTVHWTLKKSLATNVEHCLIIVIIIIINHVFCSVNDTSTIFLPKKRTRPQSIS